MWQASQAGRAEEGSLLAAANTPARKEEVQDPSAGLGPKQRQAHGPKGWPFSVKGLSGAGSVDGPAHNGLVYVDVPIADFDIEPAIGVGAYPGLIVDGCPLATEVRKGHQVSRLALYAPGKYILFHKTTSQPKSAEIIPQKAGLYKGPRRGIEARRV